jgi:DNA-binding NtrC family response regulator
MPTPRGSILLVDDEEKILKALGRALREDGHDVVQTTNPQQAQRLLGERAFDVFIVDNVMPERSGLISSATTSARRPKANARRS